MLGDTSTKKATLAGIVSERIVGNMALNCVFAVAKIGFKVFVVDVVDTTHTVR